MFDRGKVVKLDFNDKTNPKARSRTHSSFGKDADINTIMTRYQKTGFFVDPNSVNPHRVPNFGDFSDLEDFTQLCSRITQAKADFMRLPASTRARFDNDVSKCLEFVSLASNIPAAVELGLLPASLLQKGALPEATPTTPPKGV